LCELIQSDRWTKFLFGAFNVFWQWWTWWNVLVMGHVEWVCNGGDKWIVCWRTKYLILDKEDTPSVETNLVLFFNCDDYLGRMPMVKPFGFLFSILVHFHYALGFIDHIDIELQKWIKYVNLVEVMKMWMANKLNFFENHIVCQSNLIMVFILT
jgi:hypothetical protein